MSEREYDEATYASELANGEASEATDKVASEHTPGPWYASSPFRHTQIASTNYYSVLISRVKDAHYDRDPSFAQVCRGGPDGGSREVGDIEANARLIAAAPSLLAACEALPLDCDFTDAADFKDNSSRFFEAMDLARQAIAKARGK